MTVCDESDGTTWLLGLEHLRVTTIDGEREAVATFGRHIIAELALNPWTENLTTDAVGVAHGAARLSRFRVEKHDDASSLARFPSEPRAGYDTDVDGEDIEWYHAVVTDAGHASESVDLAAAVAEDPGRNGIAVVLLAEATDDGRGDDDKAESSDGGAGRTDELLLPGGHLTLHDGRLHIPTPGWNSPRCTCRQRSSRCQPESRCSPATRSTPLSR